MKQKPVIFFAFANERQEGTKYLRNLPKELAGIREALLPLEIKEELEIHILTNATFEQIVDALQDKRYRDRIAVFHYGGHANSYSFLFETPDGSARETSGKNFLNLLTRPSLKLVFLNGCATENHAKHLNEAGIPLVIATSQSISDEAATSVAIRFYKGLAQAMHLEKAWLDAQETVKGIYGQEADRGIGLFRDKTSGDLSPWALYIREGSEELRFWDLSQAADNPLLGLPQIPEDYYLTLPPKPFLSLRHFEEKHAAIFFGRGREIRDLYNKIQSIFPVILYYGQSGVGKSSLLDAGLLPRLKQTYTTKYLRRNQEIGLAGTLKQCLHPNGRENELNSEVLFDHWLAMERDAEKPLLVILDQVEEAFTRPMPQSSPDAELRELFRIISNGFKQKNRRPKGKIILAYRKEYHPEIKAPITNFGIPATELFLRPISRSGIIEAIEGVTKHKWLRDKYGLKIASGEKANMPAVIADDLLEDEKSTIAPILQIWLTEMWDEEMKAHPADPRFTLEAYQQLKRRGLLLSNFLAEKFQDLNRWNPDIVDSGLLLDLLVFFTTPYNTSEQRTFRELKDRYAHLSLDLKALLGEVKKTYLLIDVQGEGESRGLRLAHDILAPLIRKEYEQSSRVGQMAARILTSKVQEKILAVGDPELRDKEIFLDDQSLDIVQKGEFGMRARTEAENDLFEKSLLAKEKRQRTKRRTRNVIYGSVLGLLALGILALTFFLRSAKDKRWAESNFIASLALAELETNPTESFKKARDAWRISPDNNFAYSALLHSQYEQIFKYEDQSFAAPFYEDILRTDDWVYPVEYSEDGKYFVAGVADGTIRIFQADGTLVDTISLKSGTSQSLVREAIFSRDGKQLIIAVDSTLLILDFDGNKLTKNYSKDYLGDIRSIDISHDPDGKFAVFSCRNQVHIWDWKQDTIVKTITHPLTEGKLNDAAISYDGNIIATGGEGEIIRIYDVDGRLMDSIPCNDQINSLAFNPKYDAGDTSEIWLVSALGDDKILAWHSLENKMPRTFSGHSDIVYAIRFSNNGKYFVSTSRDNSAKLWDLELGSAILTLKGHRAEVYRAAFSPNDRNVITTSLDGTLKKWALTEKPIPKFSLHHDRINSLEISADGAHLVSTSNDNTLVVWRFSDSSVYRTIEPCGFLVEALFGSKVSNILIACDDKIAVWNFINDSLQEDSIKINDELFISNIAISDDKKLLAVSYGSEIQIRNTNDLKYAAETLKGHQQDINSISFSPADDKLISTSWDEQVIIWNLNDPEIFSSADIGSIGNDAIFKLDGSQSIIGTSAAEILILGEDNEIALRLNQHAESVSGLSRGPRGDYFTSISEDKTLGLWSSNGELITLFENKGSGGPTTAIFSDDGENIVIGYENGEILFLPIDPDRLIGQKEF